MNTCSESETVSDAIGNSYFGNIGNIFITTSYSGDSYVVYYLGGKYSTLKLDLAVCSKSKDWLNGGFIIIGNDDNTLYSTGIVTKEFLPVNLEIDVSGLDWLRIKAVNGNKPEKLQWIVSNPGLYKE